MCDFGTHWNRPENLGGDYIQLGCEPFSGNRQSEIFSAEIATATEENP